MKVALINSLDDRNDPAVAWQINQVIAGNVAELWLATPHEDGVQIARDLGLSLAQVYDLYSQSYLDQQTDGQGLWFYDLKVPEQGQLLVHPDWTKSMVVAGRRVADVRWFAGSNRLVQAVTWLDASGQADRKTIYQRNGRLFAQQYFQSGQLLQSDFYLGGDQIVCQEFYFEGVRNFVLTNNQERYQSAELFLKAVMGKRVDCAVQISGGGRLLALAPVGTTLFLPDQALTDQGQLDADFAAILRDKNHPIVQVVVNQRARAQLEISGLPLDKVSWLSTN